MGFVDFLRYADFAAELVNAPLASCSEVSACLSGRPWLQARVEERDVAALRRLQRDLRAIFTASDACDENLVVELINSMLARHPVSPYLAGHDSQTWHLHVAERGSSVAGLLTAESALGLAMLVADYGPTRLGVCCSDKCDSVFIDTSPNSSRRYCSDRCSSRANVAAYRARRRAEAAS